MHTLIQLGISIERRRNQLRLTQKDLAQITGLSDATLRAIEQGKPGVSIKNWITVTDALGLELRVSVKKMSDETRNSNEQ